MHDGTSTIDYAWLFMVNEAYPSAANNSFGVNQCVSYEHYIDYGIMKRYSNINESVSYWTREVAIGSDTHFSAEPTYWSEAEWNRISIASHSNGFA